MLLIDSHGHSTQAGVHAVLFSVLIYRLFLRWVTQEDTAILYWCC